MLDDVLMGARGLSYTTGKFTMMADWRLAIFFYFLHPITWRTMLLATSSNAL